jgi:hypothetical protein
MLALPQLLARAGIDGMLLLFVALELAGLALIAWLPEGGRTVSLRSGRTAMPRLPLWLGLAGCFFFFFNVGAVWTYVERMAALAGFSAVQIGNSLALGVAFGIPGALLASWCADRFGFLGPLAIGTAGTLAALWMLGEGTSLGAYATAVALYNFVWNFSLPFQYGAVNRVDPSGRGVAAAPAFHGAGVAIGPGLTALYVTQTDLSAVNWIAAMAVLSSLTFFALAVMIATRDANRGQ